jgi:hypothetical protein
MATAYLPRIPGVPLFPVPSHDRFLRWAAHAAIRRDRGTAQDLERALAPVYPDIDVRVESELATLAIDPGWYLYRDPRRPGQPRESMADPGHPRPGQEARRRPRRRGAGAHRHLVRMHPADMPDQRDPPRASRR